MTRSLAMLALAFCVPAQAAESVLGMSCDAREPRMHLASRGTLEAMHQAQPIEVDAGELISYAPEDGRGNAHRTGSRSVRHACGRFSVEVAGGFLNANPQGELGAVVYPIVEVFDGPKRIAGPMAIGTCDASNPRYGYAMACPEEWAAEVRVSDHRGKSFVRVVRTYEAYWDGP